MLWRKRENIQKFHKGIWPLVAAAAGGLASFLTSKKKNKVEELPQYTGPRSQTELRGGQNLLDQLLARQGASGRLRDVYYNDIYQPTANQARQDWSSYTEPAISSGASARGLGRSSLVEDLLRRSIQEREGGLATLAGNLRSQGFQSGLQQEDFGTSGLQNFVGNEANLASQAAGMDYNRANTMYGMNKTNADARANALPNALMTAGNIYSGIGGMGGSSLIDILLQNSQQRRRAITRGTNAGGQQSLIDELTSRSLN